MQTRDESGLTPREYEACVQAARELAALDARAPSADELAREMMAAKATEVRRIRVVE